MQYNKNMISIDTVGEPDTNTLIGFGTFKNLAVIMASGVVEQLVETTSVCCPERGSTLTTLTSAVP